MNLDPSQQPEALQERKDPRDRYYIQVELAEYERQERLAALKRLTYGAGVVAIVLTAIALVG